MTRSRKFLFDTSFDADSPAQPPEAEATPPAPEPEPVPSFTQADLEAARMEGMTAGRAEGAKEALAEQERNIAQALTTIAATLQELSAQQSAASVEQEKVALNTALAIVGKLFPRLAATHGLAEIEQIIGECLQRLREEPRIVVRVADSLLDSLRERIDGITQQAGFDGRVVLLADETLASDSVRVEWADGGAVRDSEQVWKAVEAVVGDPQSTETKRHAVRESDQNESWSAADRPASNETLGLAQSA